MVKNRGTQGQGRPQLGTTKTEAPNEGPPTYAEIGITYKEAARAQKAVECESQNNIFDKKKGEFPRPMVNEGYR